MTATTRGVLYPARLPSLHRIPAPEPVSALVRWFWIPEWDIAPGRSSRQHVVAYPASNLVVEADGVGFAGPTTRRSHRDLRGRGWAVGALLRPAAVPAFVDDPAALRDAYRQLHTAPPDPPGRYPADLHAGDLHAGDLYAGDLYRAVTETMTAAGPDAGARRERAVAVFTAWLMERIPAPTAAGRTANALADLIETDPTVRRIEDAADRLGVSSRTLQRLAATHVGLSPAAMIRRRRLQEAAQRLRDDPSVSLAELAADLGYADHAHLTNEFRRVLGLTPSGYRREVSGEARES
ncbi:AraC family transcriptional regulator [Tersicoccus solisilvae]|uniref:AraC family transcriptional regulator n=1 Tax=Tersicoccus solisilvae TaxID=1882339 RepID=A0ABQ1P491_9MICC|nr:helix-turn-helix domain-containing protein [Tersicoccus solisilvae]GGC90693.1 AraC family transcriptional regulator [Tersicoccus solisilvae]